MTDEIVIVTPELAAGAGGVADYTLRLISEWRDRGRYRFILPQGAPASTQLDVEFVRQEAADFRKNLPTHDGKVLVQYSAYGFDRRGYPRWLLRELVDWKTRTGGLLVIIFHEIWTFRSVLNKDYLVQQLHRRAIARVLGVADAVFTSTSSQAEHLRKLAPHRAIELLPVGSNIPVPESPNDSREPGHAVLFGLESSRIRDLRALQIDLRALAAAKVVSKVTTCGGFSSPNEQSILAALPLTAGFAQRGQLPPREISDQLARATFAISAQDPLSLQKSGTFMAYASHGLNMISPHADPSGGEPICWLLHPRELLQGIDAAELKSRAENLRAWQKRTASWPEIAARIGHAIQLRQV